jgi:hypothetical protein
MHLFALFALIGLAWFRGENIDKKWLVIFPCLALIFDLTPILSNIPLVPTVMNLLATILGVAATGISKNNFYYIKVIGQSK